MVDSIGSVNAVGNVIGYRVTPYTARTQVNTTHTQAPMQGQVQNENTGAATIPVSSPTNQTNVEQEKSKPSEENKEGNPGSSGESYQDFSEEEKRLVSELKTTDRSVRTHEQAHVAAGGNLVTKGATYSFRTGPDGKRYAVAGEVQIDTSAVADDPEATIIKADRIVRAALAPADPSSQDRMVAAAASRMRMNAQTEIARQAYESTGTYSSATSLGLTVAG